LELNLPISTASFIGSKNSTTGTLLLSPFQGSTKLATHISFVAVAIDTNFPLNVSIVLYSSGLNVQPVDAALLATKRQCLPLGSTTLSGQFYLSILYQWGAFATFSTVAFIFSNFGWGTLQKRST
jgi:hypothetical protein